MFNASSFENKSTLFYIQLASARDFVRVEFVSRQNFSIKSNVLFTKHFSSIALSFSANRTKIRSAVSEKINYIQIWGHVICIVFYICTD